MHAKSRRHIYIHRPSERKNRSRDLPLLGQATFFRERDRAHFVAFKVVPRIISIPEPPNFCANSICVKSYRGFEIGVTILYPGAEFLGANNLTAGPSIFLLSPWRSHTGPPWGMFKLIISKPYISANSEKELSCQNKNASYQRPGLNWGPSVW